MFGCIRNIPHATLSPLNNTLVHVYKSDGLTLELLVPVSLHAEL